MKHIIYLDTDYLNSYISQILGGLPRSTTTEAGDKQEITDNDEVHNRLKGELKAPFVKLEAAMGSENIQEIKDTSYGKELVQKIFHDNLLDIFEQHLQTNELLKKDIKKASIGDYVYFCGDFNAQDFSSYLNLVSKENIKTTANILAIPEIEKEKAKAEGQGNTLKNTEKYVKSALDETLAPFKKAVEAFALFFPGDQLFCFDEFLAPIKERFLREPISLINYLYGGQINIIGKVTRISSSEPSVKIIKKEFAEMTNSLNSMTDSLILDSAEYKIVVPIALYFG